MSEEKKKDNTNEKKGVSFEALSSLDAPVSFWKGIPFGLQHVMAMFVANLAPIFLVASAANMSAEQSATIIQAGLLVAGLGTCLQLYGVWLIGSRLPMVTGISFTYVAAAMSIAQNQGYGAVAGAVVLGGCTIMMFGNIILSGFQMISEAGYTQRNITIAALSLTIGIGFTQVGDIFVNFPPLFQSIFASNCIAVAFVVAVLLNALLPSEEHFLSAPQHQED